MVITELDKAWIRATTAKLLRQGKLKRQRCAVCGAAQARHRHTDYSDPEHLRWLCKRHMNEQSLSVLQRSLLKDGLLSHYHTRPLDLALRLPDPGCFGLKEIMIEFKDRRERAAKRAAAGLSIARLTGRGLLECCSRGHWRLTRAGVALARRLFPKIKPPTKRELAHNIVLHKGIQNWADTHPRLA